MRRLRARAHVDEPTSEEGPIRWLRYAWAAFLGLSILAMTYVLFDEDLGTPVPLFQEFTCRGKLDVTLTDPAGKPELRVPEMAVKMRAAGDGETRPAFFRLFIRDNADSDWREYFTFNIPGGEHLNYVGQITNETQLYVSAKDTEGEYCGNESDVISAPK